MTPTPDTVIKHGGSRAARHAGVHAKAFQHEPAAALGHRVTPQEREQMIAEAAYFRAEQRGFTPGGELDDWIEAEVAIDRALAAAAAEDKPA